MRKTIYQNKDFCLSVCLIAAGCKFLGCEEENNSTIYKFEDTDSLRQLDHFLEVIEVSMSPIMSESSVIRSLKSVVNAYKTPRTKNVRSATI